MKFTRAERLEIAVAACQDRDAKVAEWDAYRAAQLRRAIDAGVEVTELAERMGVARTTVYRWLRAGGDRADQ